MTIQYTPLLLKYLKAFQDDPSSKIFAPLAECYLKLGLVDEAIEICKEVLAVSPNFNGGKVALARAYFDKKMYKQVRELLSKIIDEIPENIIAQRLLADSSFMTGHLNEALNAYKMVLYYQPDEREVYAIIKEMETQMYEKGGLLKAGGRPEKVQKIIKLQKMLEKAQKAQGVIIC
mgnify:CR=1 FL=1